MIGVIDYGAGNLFSVTNALRFLGLEYDVVSDERGLREADRLILPGVGAFPDAMESLKKTGLDKVIKEESEKKPLLGICLGMQMLFEKSDEYGETKGLGLIPGKVVKMQATGLKIPHMGWNEVTPERPCALSKGVRDGDRFYYVHSYKAVTDPEYISLSSEYGTKVPGLVFRDKVFGAQCHPEKSGKLGLAMLKCFGGLK